jgi:hypothetical protein
VAELEEVAEEVVAAEVMPCRSRRPLYLQRPSALVTVFDPFAATLPGIPIQPGTFAFGIKVRDVHGGVPRQTPYSMPRTMSS